MATINADGTTTHTPRLLGFDGTWLIGTVEASYREIAALFGEEDSVPSICPFWGLLVRNPDPRGANERAGVYPSTSADPRRTPDQQTQWNVNGRSSMSVDAVRAALDVHRAAKATRCLPAEE